jgi:hypothetical protein
MTCPWFTNFQKIIEDYKMIAEKTAMALNEKGISQSWISLMTINLK